MTIDLKHFQEKLEKEAALLEGELKSIGRRNPSNPNDWEAEEKIDEVEERPIDPDEVADRLEEYEENSAELKQEETQYNDVKDAMKRIAEGTYGKCSICGEEIPTARLEANPSAKNCIAHAK
ncbi:MAG: TraR/DksA C4-type zinc finger protein [bacterium]